MKQKEYPMDEDYNRAAAFLAEMIAEREELAEVIKNLPPNARPEALRLLSDLDKAIDEREQKLANEYEAFQNYQKLTDERDEMFDELVRRLAGAYVHIKYRNPEALAEMEATINNMPPEQAQEFYDCAAILESGDLIRIIAREGETREQTEEFLRNYRTEKEKEHDIVFNDILESFAGAFVHAKYRHPHLLPKLEAEMKNMPPEYAKAFYERIAKIEETDLISFIALEGETLEDTEEFLRNYRAAESNNR